MNAWTQHPVLVGRHVRLEPLTLAHSEGLYEAGRDPSIWTWLSVRQPHDLAATQAMIKDILANQDRVAFAQIDLATGQVAGTTSFYDLEPLHRSLAIGFTWIGAPWQRTAINTEAKLLLMTYAFTELSANRITWHADALNERSRRAIERLGARQEGILRSHWLRPDGTFRDTVVYSVISTEWPGVRDGLLLRLNQTRKQTK